MSKPKYIALVILSLLFSVAWLLGLYVSLGLSGFSTERRMWLFIPSLLCLVPSWFIDKRLIKEGEQKDQAADIYRLMPVPLVFRACACLRTSVHSPLQQIVIHSAKISRP